MPIVLQKTIFLCLNSVKKLKISRICLPLERLKEGKLTWCGSGGGGGGRSAKNLQPPWQNPRYAPESSGRKKYSKNCAYRRSPWAPRWSPVSCPWERRDSWWRSRGSCRGACSAGSSPQQLNNSSLKKSVVPTRVVDPHWFNSDPDPGFWWPKIEEINYNCKTFNIFWIENCNFLILRPL